MELGVADHPALAGKKRPASMRVALAKVVYHCDLDGMFRGAAKQARVNLNAKRKRARLDMQLGAHGSRRRTTFDTVVQAAIKDHLLSRHEASPGRMYEAPRSLSWADIGGQCVGRACFQAAKAGTQ